LGPATKGKWGLATLSVAAGPVKTAIKGVWSILVSEKVGNPPLYFNRLEKNELKKRKGPQCFASGGERVGGGGVGRGGGGVGGKKGGGSLCKALESDLKMGRQSSGT